MKNCSKNNAYTIKRTYLLQGGMLELGIENT